MGVNVFMLFVAIVLIITISIGKFNDLIYSIIRFILGLIVIHLCCDYYMDNGVFHKEYPHAKEGAIIYVANYIFYITLFFSSLFLLLIKKENRKKIYFVIPTIVFVLILFVVIYIENSVNSLAFFGISLFISFFPLHLFSYYLKFLKK